MADKVDKYIAKAAQLWCLPQHGQKEMDTDFAYSIAQALRESAADAFVSSASLSASKRPMRKPFGPDLSEFAKGYIACANELEVSLWARAAALRAPVAKTEEKRVGKCATGECRHDDSSWCEVESVATEGNQ